MYKRCCCELIASLREKLSAVVLDAETGRDAALAEIADLRKANTTLMSALTDSMENIIRYQVAEDEVVKLRDTCEGLQGDLADLREHTAQLKQEVSTLNMQLYEHDKASADEIERLRVELEERTTECEHLSKRLDEIHDDNERLRVLLQLDKPWPVADVLDRLADAAAILLSNDYDGHGWEDISRGVKLAREYAASIRAALAPPHDCIVCKITREMKEDAK